MEKLKTQTANIKQSAASSFESEMSSVRTENYPRMLLETDYRYAGSSLDKNGHFPIPAELNLSGHPQSHQSDLQFAATDFQGFSPLSGVPDNLNPYCPEKNYKQQELCGSNIMAATGSSNLDFETGSNCVDISNGFTVPLEQSRTFSEKVGRGGAVSTYLASQDHTAATSIKTNAGKSELGSLQEVLKDKQSQLTHDDDDHDDNDDDNDIAQGVAASLGKNEVVKFLANFDEKIESSVERNDDNTNKSKNVEEVLESDDEDMEDKEDNSGEDMESDDSDAENTAQLEVTFSAPDNGTDEVPTEPSEPIVDSRGFQCKVCFKWWKFKKGLNKHMKTHIKKDQQTSSFGPANMRYDDGIIRAFPCSLCPYKAKQKKDLKKHMLVHTTDAIHKCKLCKFSSKRKYSLNRHLRRVHPSARMYECNVCNFKTITSESLITHMARHETARMYECNICNFKTMTSASLNTHMARHESARTTSSAVLIKERSNVLKHLISQSRSLRSTCKKCEEIYSTSNDYMNHLSSHKDSSGFEDTLMYGQESSNVITDQPSSIASTSELLPQDSKIAISTALVEAKLSRMSTVITRLTDLTKVATSATDKSSIAPQLTEISALAMELFLMSGSMLPPNKNTYDGNGKMAGMSNSSDYVTDYTSFMDDDYELSDVMGMYVNSMKDDISTDALMQIQVDMTGNAVTCVQKRHPNSQKSRVSKRRKNRHLTCVLCNLVLSDFCNLRRHLMVHVDARPYTCEICGLSFRRPEHKRNHMVTHSTERPFECPECPYRAKTEDRLKVHMFCHPQNKEFACQFCNFSGDTSQELDQHMKKHKPQTCFQCGFFCYSRTEMKKHLFTHSSFSCNQCEYNTTDSVEYSRHMKKHTAVLRLCCELCGYSCDTTTKFNYHKLRHENKTPFHCPECDYKCSSRASFDCHKLKHAGLKPYLCSFCGASFRKTSYLNQHMLIHKDEKSFKCSICNYSCRSSFNLKEHEMTHSGEKPHACKYCSFSSRRRKALLLHMAKHENVY